MELRIRRKPSVVKVIQKYAGKWLKFKQVQFEIPESGDSSSTQKQWEYVERHNHRQGNPQQVDAVEIVATLKRKNVPDHLVLVTQYRPPIQAYTIEFPAGLIDYPDSSSATTKATDVNYMVEETARRELKEECGYEISSIERISPPIYNDPGLTNTNCKLVFATIDGDTAANLNPKPEHEPDEWSLDVILVGCDELLEQLESMASTNQYTIDAKVYAYAVMLKNTSNT